MSSEFYSVTIPTMFGLGSLSVVLLAWASNSHIHQKVALILLFAWCATMIVSAFGVANENYMLPSVDMVVAITVAWVGGKKFPPVAVVVFAIYGVVGIVHVGARILHAHEGYNYFATLGYLFLAQLITTGALSGRLAVRRWVALGRQRSRPYPARS